MLSRIFVFETRVDVTDEIYTEMSGDQLRIPRTAYEDRALTVIIIVAYYNFFYLPVLAHLAPEIFVKGVEMVLQLAGVHLVLRIIGWVLVEVG